MPYNTRRKSLSLPSLGIHLPNSSRAHRPALKPTASIEITEMSQSPPTKKIKRSHDGDEPMSPVSSPRSKTGSPALDLPRPAHSLPRKTAEHTPPPSPGDVVQFRKVDTEGINDDIVVAVIQQLEKTGNRPHLIKDLATVLAATNDSIAHSANPAALLSSRLSLYLKRPWTALSPCPLAKELIPVHPRKVFFYLTTQPRVPLPDTSDDIIPRQSVTKTLTPSVSDHSQGDDDLDLEARERMRLSPSPEVDLYSPELDHAPSMDASTPLDFFSARSSLNPDGNPDTRHRPNRAPSPPLEADERGFTETATAVRARGMSLHDQIVKLSVESGEPVKAVASSEETPEQGHKRDQELGLELFGGSHPGLHIPEQKMFSSSPMMHAKQDHHNTMAKHEVTFDLDDMEIEEASWTSMSPEQIDVDELDTLFTHF